MDYPIPDAEQIREYARDAQECAYGLSARAQERLLWLLHYADNGRSVSETCRHFGIPRMTLYRVFRRFRAGDPDCLEDLSRRPHTVRTAKQQTQTVVAVQPAVVAQEMAQPVIQQAVQREHNCLMCRIQALGLGKTLKRAFVLGSVLTNIAFITFVLATAMLEGRHAAADVTAASDSLSLE